jgi:hypothetical protein
MNITTEVRNVLTERIYELDRAIENLGHDIEWQEEALSQAMERRRELSEKRVELAKFLGVVL